MMTKHTFFYKKFKIKIPNFNQLVKRKNNPFLRNLLYIPLMILVVVFSNFFISYIFLLQVIFIFLQVYFIICKIKNFYFFETFTLFKPTLLMLSLVVCTVSFNSYSVLETFEGNSLLKEEEEEKDNYFQKIFKKDLNFSQNNFFGWEQLKIFDKNILFQDALLINTNYDSQLSYKNRYSIIENYEQFIIYQNKFGCNENFSEVRSVLGINSILNDANSSKFLQDYLNFKLRLFSGKIVY
jgi:hypothetical protein